VYPDTLAGVGAAGRDLKRIAVAQADVMRVVEQVAAGLRERVANAAGLAGSARALLDEFSTQAADDVRWGLATLDGDLDETTIPAIAELPTGSPSTEREWAAGARALERVARVETASMRVFTSGFVLLDKVRKDNVSARDRAAKARSLLWRDDPGQAELTDRLDVAVRRPSKALQGWPSALRNDRVTTADLDGTRQTLTAQAPEVRSATERLNRVVDDVFAAAPSSWQHGRALAADLRAEVRRLFPIQELPGELREAHKQFSDLWAQAPEQQPVLTTADFADVASVMVELAGAAKGLKAALRATPWWRADALLGPGHGFTREQVTRVMDLADRLFPASQPTRTDTEKFAWLTGQIPSPNPDDLGIQAVGPSIRRLPIGRLFALLELATQVYETQDERTSLASASKDVGLARLANLRLLVDLVGAEAGVPDVTFEHLEAEYRHLYQPGPDTPVTRSDLAGLVQRVGQLRASRRSVEHAELERLAQVERRVGDARSYLTRAEDLEQPELAGLVRGLVTDRTSDSLSTLLDLLVATSTADLANLFGDGKLARRLLSAIPADDQLHPKLAEFTAERFAVPPEQMSRFTARTERGESYVRPTPVDRTFRPAMVFPSLDVGVNDTLTPEQFEAVCEHLRNGHRLASNADAPQVRDDNAVLRPLGLSAGERAIAMGWLDRLHAAIGPTNFDQ
jgi:hypothetical protein